MRGVLTRVEQKIEEWPKGTGRKKSVIWLFIRGEDKKRYVFKDPFFEPYCYFNRGVLNVTSFPKEVKKHAVVKIEGKSYVKVWTDFPTSVAKLRNIVEHKKPNIVTTFEADIVFPLRYIIDKLIRGPVEFDPGQGNIKPIDENIPSNLRILILDIETLGNEIICLTIWDNYDEKYYTWYWRKNPLMIEEEKDWVITWCEDEVWMLKEALKFIRKKNPDVVTGYNVDFDLVEIRKRVLSLASPEVGTAWDYICPMQGKTRADVYRMPPPRDRRKKFRDFWVKSKHQRIPGRNVVDLLQILMKIGKHQLSEFNLDFVARHHLKPSMGKRKFNGIIISKMLGKMWNKHPVEVLKYNKMDVELCVELNKQLALIAFADEIRKFVGIQLDDIQSNKRIAHIELLRKSKKPFPVTKREKRSFKGAIVIEPKKGVYKWVIVMDFTSLYPSVILQLNIDPDTYISTKWRHKYNITNAYILKDKDENTEYWFKKKPEGDLSAVLRKFLALRKDKKIELERTRKTGNKELTAILDTQQYALKVITNAFYGSLMYRGQPSAWMCARAITCGARESIRFAKKEIEKLGYMVIYGDTDSIMIASKFSSYKKVVEEADYLSKRVSVKMPKFLSSFGGTGDKSYINLALDKVFKHFLMDEKKKRYAGIPITKYGEDKLEVKGFGTVRSDTSKFTGELQRRLLKEILLEKEKGRIKYLTELELEEFTRRPLTEIGVPCVLTKPPSKYKGNSIQKKAFHFTNKYLGGDFRVGDKPKRIYVKTLTEKAPIEMIEPKGVDVIVYDVNDLKLPDWLEIDYPKQVNRTVKPKIEKVLQFVEIEWKDLKLPSILIKKKKKRKKKAKKLKKARELVKGQTKLG